MSRTNIYVATRSTCAHACSAAINPAFGMGMVFLERIKLKFINAYVAAAGAGIQIIIASGIETDADITAGGIRVYIHCIGADIADTDIATRSVGVNLLDHAIHGNAATRRIQIEVFRLHL